MALLSHLFAGTVEKACSFVRPCDKRTGGLSDSCADSPHLASRLTLSTRSRQLSPSPLVLRPRFPPCAAPSIHLLQESRRSLFRYTSPSFTRATSDSPSIHRPHLRRCRTPAARNGHNSLCDPPQTPFPRSALSPIHISLFLTTTRLCDTFARPTDRPSEGSLIVCFDLSIPHD